MDFILNSEQELFRSTLDELLTSADVPSAVRSWAAGSHEAGRALWKSLADAGVFAVAVPEAAGGVGVLPVELVTAFRVLGAHGVPGPYVETVAAAQLLPEIGDGSRLVSLALPPEVPYALDADAADVALVADEAGVRHGQPGAARESIDPARRLFPLTPGEIVSSAGSAADAYDLGVLLCAAQLSGLGDRLLAITVEYAKTRQQFGRPIGEFQAVKHHLADAYVTLEHARPLLYGAALAHGSPSFARDVSAAKAAASEASYFASRIALQVHGAIGYTDEYDPTLLIRKARALRNAWGSPSAHKARVLASLP